MTFFFQNYRRFSSRIFDLLLSYGCPVEKLGMDENFMDVTQIVQKRRKEKDRGSGATAVGHRYGEKESSLADLPWDLAEGSLPLLSI